MNKMVIKSIVFLSVSSLALARNDPYRINDKGSDSKNLGDAVSEKLKAEVKARFSDCEIEENEATSILDSWISGNSSSWGFGPPKIQEIRNEGIRQIKEAATKAVDLYNQKIGELGDKVSADFAKSISQNSPKMVVRGSYGYMSNQRDPGDPGWSLVEKFHEGLDKVSGSGDVSYDVLDGVDLSGSIGVAGIEAKVPIKIGAGFSASGQVGSITLGEGTPFSTPTKPTTKTTYSPRCTVGGSASVTAKNLVKVSASGSISVIWSFGEITFNLVAEPQ